MPTPDALNASGHAVRVLVTGASGLIGLHVIEALRAVGVVPVAFDAEPFTALPGPRSALVTVTGDVTDRDAITSALQDHRIERVIHLAAILQRSAQEDPVRAVAVNIGGSLNVLEAARTLGIRRVVVASSIAVYGDVCYDPVDERHPCSPTTAYGAAKLFVENSGRVYGERYGLEFVALRYGATYGPGPAQTRSAGAATDLRAFFEDAVRSGEAVLWGPPAKRPLVYVKDAAYATALACLVEPPPASFVFNVAGRDGASLADCAAVLAKLLPGLHIIHREKPGTTRPMTATLTIDRAAAAFGYTPRYSLEEGIRDYVRTLQHPPSEAGASTADAKTSPSTAST